MRPSKIGLVGLGNVGYALGRGLSGTEFGPAVLACDRNEDKRERLAEDAGIGVTGDWREAMGGADLILLAVRTGQVVPLLAEAATVLQDARVLVCLSAGIQEASLQAALPASGPAPIRVIANVNVASTRGFSMVFRHPERPLEEEHAAVEEVFSAVGEVLAVSSESDLDRMSVLPGCAPAAFSLFAEGLELFGREAGFDSKGAARVVEQTLNATLATMELLGVSAIDYKHRVAAPGGVVDQVLSREESENLKQSVGSWHRFILKKLEGA